MEGGQEGEQGDSEGDDKREDVPSGNVVNFYFTNFPLEWNKVNLHELFAEIGEIAHVYVARKLSKSGKRFGFARFFRVGNLQALEKRLNRIKIGSFKLRANIAKFEKNTSKSDQGCKRKGWVFDIPCKLNTLPTLSSSISQTRVPNTLDGVPFEIYSISELHHLWSSFGATNCKVKYIGGSLFSLEFRNNEEGCNLTRSDSKKSVDQGVEFETGSNHVEDGFDNVEPLGITLKCETPNESVQDGSEEEPSYVAGTFPEKDGCVDACDASPFPAHSHQKGNSNFELGYGSDSCIEKKGHVTDNGSRLDKGDGDLSYFEEKVELGGVDLSPCVEKVGLIKPSPFTDLKERCNSYCHGLDHVEISDGLISQKDKLPTNEKATHVKKRKMKTMNLFKLIQIKQREKLMNDMKKGTPRLRSSKALNLLRQVAL